MKVSQVATLEKGSNENSECPDQPACRCNVVWAIADCTLLLLSCSALLMLKLNIISLGLCLYNLHETVWVFVRINEYTLCMFSYGSKKIYVGRNQLLNPLKTEMTLPHYILEESIFDFRYVRLYDIDIP